MGFKQRSKNSVSGKSPSTEAMKKTAELATLNGGVTQDFAAHVENIRDTSKLLGYNVMKQGVTRNLLKYSEEFDNSIWVKGATSINVNNITAPDGKITCDKVISTVFPSGKCNIRQTLPITTNTTYTISAYFKSAEWTRVEFQILDNVPTNLNIFPVFSISGKTQVTGGGIYPFTNVLIQDAPNDFVRISYTFTTPSVLTNVILQIYPTPNNGLAGTYSGDGISGIYVWGVQLETGSQLTKYQPTQNIPIDSDFTATNLMYVPSSYGEGKNFSQSNLRNLLRFSEEFDNAVWGKQHTTITPNLIANPINGIINVDKLVEDSANDQHNLNIQIPTLLKGYTYILSLYVKLDTRSRITLRISDNQFLNYAQGNFNLNDNTFNTGGNLGFTQTTPTIVDSLSGFKLLTLKGVSNVDSLGYVQIRLLNDNGNSTYQGDGTSGLYIWGTQLEQSPIPTPYQRTTDAILDFNFTRATSARVTNKLGIIEDSCYNLIRYSEQFELEWTRRDINIISNAIIAPNGTLTADKLVPNTNGTVRHEIFKGVGIILPNTNYRFSIYAKAGEYSFLRIGIPSLGSDIYFDLINGIVVTPSPKYSIVNIGNGWYQCFLFGISNPTISDYGIYLSPDKGLHPVYAGDDVSGIYLWGAQFIQGLTPRPYLKTTTRINIPKLEYTINTRNLIKYSEEFDNLLWVKSFSSIIINTIISPVSTLTSDKLIEDTTNSAHYIHQIYNIISGNTYTFSIYLKASERHNVRIAFQTDGGFGSGQHTASVNLITGVIYSSIGLIKSTIIDVGNGWYRCSITAIALNTATEEIFIFIFDNIGNQTYLGDGTSGIYIWGSQLERGSVATPYAKTTNIPVTLNTEASLLIEPQRTNLVLQSEDFTQASWVKNNTTITPNTNLNPFGINKSYYLVEDTTNSQHHLNVNTPVTSGLSYTFSYYVKKVDDSWVQFNLGGVAFGNAVWINFNFDTGLFGNKGTTGTWNVKVLTNGYWLITVASNAISTGNNPGIALVGANNIDTTSRGLLYLGTGRKICEVAAIQVEQGSNPTSYIPTTTATVTRNGDVNFIDLFNNNTLNKNNFTFYCEGFLFDRFNSQWNVCLSDNITFSNTNQIGFYGGIVGLTIKSGVITNSGSGLPNNSAYKFVLQYDNTTANFYRNGVLIGTQTVPVFDYRYLVINNGGTTFTVDKLELFNRNLSDADCILLTTL